MYKSCECTERNKNNWYVEKKNIVVCTKCGNRWYSNSKYKLSLKTKVEFLRVN